jgi:hypothetical protein
MPVTLAVLNKAPAESDLRKVRTTLSSHGMNIGRSSPSRVDADASSPPLS